MHEKWPKGMHNIRHKLCHKKDTKGKENFRGLPAANTGDYFYPGGMGKC